MKLLFVAADPMEYRGILVHVRNPRTVVLDLDWAHSGSLGEHSVLLTANGAGWKCAAKATDQGCASFRPEAIVSTGFCGALDETLQIADIVCATAVNDCSARLVSGAFP